MSAPEYITHKAISLCKTLTESCVLIEKDVKEGRLSIEEAMECLELDRAATEQAVKTYVNTNTKTVGIVVVFDVEKHNLDKAFIESREAFNKCKTFLTQRLQESKSE